MKNGIILLCVFLLFTACPFNQFLNNQQPAKSNIKTISEDLDTSAPTDMVKICFIHHSTGSAWISSGSGGLGTALNNNNYYAAECDYGWDAETGDSLGDRTDTENWPEWFTDTKMPYVYANSSHYDYINTMSEPVGENQIIMFKSCYPNSEVGSSIDNEKSIYNSLLTYFQAHMDKMFILVIPPPEIVINNCALTRELSNWLVDRQNGWLSGYSGNNVYAFNYYNILTDPANHHYINSENSEVNIVTGDPIDSNNPDELYYYTGSDNHPTAAGHQKATEEFLPLLNAWYHLWKD